MLSFPVAHAITQTYGTDQNSRQENQKYGRLAMLRMRDVYPGSLFLPIPDLGSRIQKQQWKSKDRGEKKLGSCHTFFLEL